MWIPLTLCMVVLLGLSDGFHLQNQAGVRRAVCRRAPPCCPGHVCRAYQRFDASRPVAACARTVDGRPLYAPGSQAQQRVCGAGSRSAGLRGAGSIGFRGLGAAGGASGARGMSRFGRRRGQGFDMIGQAQTGGRPAGGLSAGRLGAGQGLSWDQSRSQGLPRFPGQQMRIPGQDMRIPGQEMRIPGQEMRIPGQDMSIPSQDMRIPGQDMRIPGQEMRGHGQMGFPEFPSMPSFGDQRSQQDLFSSGLNPDQTLGQNLGQPNTFQMLPGRQGQRSFGRMEDQRLGLGQSSLGQGQTSFGSQLQGGQGFPSGPMVGGSMPGFDQSSLGSQSFGSQSFGGPSMSGRSTGGQSFGGQSFGRTSFGQLPSSAGGGLVPQPFLVEQPPVSASPIIQDQSMPSGAGSQQP